MVLILGGLCIKGTGWSPAQAESMTVSQPWVRNPLQLGSSQLWISQGWARRSNRTRGTSSLSGFCDLTKWRQGRWKWVSFLIPQRMRVYPTARSENTWGRGREVWGREREAVLFIPEVSRSKRNGFYTPGHTLCLNSVAFKACYLLVSTHSD